MKKKRRKNEIGKKILEEQLKDVVGGGGDIVENAFAFLDKLGDVAAQLKKASETNTCPFCNQPIVTGAENCELKEVVMHIANAHGQK